MTRTTSAAPDPARRRIDAIELVAGLVVTAICVGLAWVALDYGVGTTRRMGAGFFPVALGGLGALLGLLMALRAVLWPMHNGSTVRLRRLVCISAAFLLFALLVEPAGLLVTVLVSTFVASLADPEARAGESLALGAGLALAVWVIFVLLLGLSVPVLPGGR